MLGAEMIRRFLTSRESTMLGFAYALVVRTQLGVVAGVDRIRFHRRQDPAPLADLVTVSAKTFLRPATARRLVRSIRRIFPGRIVLADDSPEPMPAPDPLTEIVPMPFNSGVTRGRNAALARVRTPFVLVTDDDVVFTRGCALAGALRYLQENPDVDAVCATLVELPRWRSLPYPGERALFPAHLAPLRPIGELIGGQPVIAMGPPIYLARTESLRSVPYDEGLRMLDHRDFFSSACGRLVFVQDADFVVFHARTPFDRTYSTYRNNYTLDQRYLGRKWSGTGGAGR